MEYTRLVSCSSLNEHGNGGFLNSLPAIVRSLRLQIVDRLLSTKSDGSSTMHFLLLDDDPEAGVDIGDITICKSGSHGGLILFASTSSNDLKVQTCQRSCCKFLYFFF